MQSERREPTVSVVIPVHNEESVVLRCLARLLADARDGEFEVVVAANGCSDSTAEVVRRSGLPVRCLELPNPGKISALNAADKVATVYPRIYLDADILLDSAAVRALARELSGGGALAGAPRMVVDSTDCSPAVRAFYRVWTRLSTFDEGYVGSGVYAVSADGHARIAPFPAITNDDQYVHRSFAASERRTTAGTFTVRPARTVAALVRRSARVRSGNLELDRLMPADGAGPAGGSTKRADLLSLLRDLRRWPDLVVFGIVTLRIRHATARRLSTGDDGWGRDNSSRAPTSR